MDDDTESQDDGGATVDEEDYYSILNLPRDANNDHIKKSFRELSRLYHPDKHTDENLKREAVKLFTRTKKAYDVLIDPHKRAIYDTTGVRGLETEGWEVAQRTRTPEEIREEFERLARIKRELALDQATKPKGTVFMRINATDLFSDYGNSPEGPTELWDAVSGVEVSAMGFTQSVEAPLTLRDTLRMGGRLDTRNGAGSGSVSVGLQRTLQWNSVVEGTLSVGEGPSLSVRWYRLISPRLSFTVIPTVHYTPRGIQYGFVSAVSTEFDEHTTGSLGLNAGGRDVSMNASLTLHYPKVRLVLSLEVGIPHSHIGASAAFNLPHGLVLRSVVRVGTYGGILEYGLDKTVSERTVMGATVSIGIPTGVALKIKVLRGRQTYSFPIQLCDEVIPAPVFYATVIPVIAWKLMKTFIIDPIELEESKRKSRETQEKNKKRMEEARQEAETAKKLMAAQFERVRFQEEGRAGVVIVKARYGRLVSNGTEGPAHRNNADDSEAGVIDVTVPLQCLVSDSKLVLHSAPKSQLVGFYDPCVGDDKQLMVYYKFSNADHLVTVKDDEPLRIPLAAHRLTAT